MKFALSTVDCGNEEIAAIARQNVYDGVELSFPQAVAAKFEQSDLAIACVAGGTSPITHGTGDDSRSAHVRWLVNLAASLGCSLVKINESPLKSGQNRSSSGLALGDWLLPLADYAAERAVTLALDNSQSRRTARETWAILDRCNHPSLGCCLDALTAAFIGDSPQVTVPMLNSRIVYVQLSDVKDLAMPAMDCDLGDGVVQIKTTINRLRGIGYSGWLTLRTVTPIATSVDIFNARLSKSIQSLRQWTNPASKAKAKSKA
jgi:sugar phosphate isomerase/epimerase